eukprot:COSAG01_NODE_3065_length_6646_cov_13.181610_1_plen_96_part_00
MKLIHNTRAAGHTVLVSTRSGKDVKATIKKTCQAFFDAASSTAPPWMSCPPVDDENSLLASEWFASFKDAAQYLESLIIIPKTADHFIGHVHSTI